MHEFTQKVVIDERIYFYLLILYELLQENRDGQVSLKNQNGYRDRNSTCFKALTV